MNLPPTSDISLYQIALNAPAPSHGFSVSPATLKSLVGALIDVLIEKKISADLWVKLPPTESWQTQLERYQQQSDLAQTIYLCNNFEDALPERIGVRVQAKGDKQEHRIFPIQLVADGQLDREFFFIVRSDQFGGLIVAYQPEPSPGEALCQTQPLLAIVSFEQRVIQQALEGIKEAIAEVHTIPKELLEHWKTEFPSLSASDEKDLLTQLLLKHLQWTEKILHSSTPISSPSNSTASTEATKATSQGVPDSVAGETTEASQMKATLANPALRLTSASDTATSPPLPASKRLPNDELLERVTQELRTPLSNMKTALRLLDSPQLKPAQRQRYMQLLHTECDRQTSLLSGFLELVQLEGDPQPTVMPSVQLADIVPGVVSTYQPIAQEKGIQLGYTIPNDLPSVSCLETWLRQILINLLHNSLKFTPSGGQVNVRATLQGEYVQLAFSDTGIGIADGEIAKIFDSFYRGRSTTGEDTGAGLGLTIVQRLLLRCGGSISVTSKLGEGSNFKVLLPIASSTPRS